MRWTGERRVIAGDLDRFAIPLEDHHHEVRAMFSRFAAERLAPGAAARDQNHAFPLAEIAELAAQGGMAMKVAEADGGPGLDNRGCGLAIEALARADASVAVVAVASNLSAAILAAHADEAQRQRLLRPLAEGRLGHAAFALTEPHAGSDAAAIRTTARRDGEDWVLDGVKQWITGASHTRLFLVFARTPDPGGVTCFAVEAGTPGFSLGRIERKMGLTSSDTAELRFDGCRVPAANVIGAVGKGYGVALSGIGPSRVAIAAQSLGIAGRAYDLGLAYARDRRAFGQPVVAFQNSRFVLADARAGIEQGWLLMLRAATLLDRGDEARTEASMAKLACSETCGRVVDAMLQLHGGNGYSAEYKIERLYRDARVMRIYEGTSEIQREVIARDILGQ
jgi:butyryl-CoA dehydrogenase